MGTVQDTMVKERRRGDVSRDQNGLGRAQVKSRGIPVPTVPCLHGRHGNCTVGTGIARLALGIAQ